MPSTTNFGWTTPADTDLVKDGAAAIRTLGNGVDASFVDLKGGTTGQILSKNSNTDLDFIWIANDQGDITAVTAGTGLTGGGSSGAVTLTNDMATSITAAGDIVVGTGSGTYDNLPIGTTGQVLTADTTVSPYKVKWAAPEGGGKVLQVVQGTSTTSTTLTSGTYTDSGLSVSITPSATSSKVLIIIAQQFWHENPTNGDDAAAKLRLVRGSTTITNTGDTETMYISAKYAGVNNDLIHNYPYALTTLDSPNTTSSTTYKTQISIVRGSVVAQFGSALSTIIAMEIGA